MDFMAFVPGTGVGERTTMLRDFVLAAKEIDFCKTTTCSEERMKFPIFVSFRSQRVSVHLCLQQLRLRS